MTKGKGIYPKFTVTRNDGTDKPGEKHHRCRYFVLDLDHDIHSQVAILAYAESCRVTHPQLSEDLFKLGEVCDRPSIRERLRVLNKIGPAPLPIHDPKPGKE